MNPKAQFPFTIRDMMNAKIEKAKSQGDPLPEWQNEKDFLRDLRANPPVAAPMHLYDPAAPLCDGASCMLLVAEK